MLKSEGNQHLKLSKVLGSKKLLFWRLFSHRVTEFSFILYSRFSCCWNIIIKALCHLVLNLLYLKSFYLVRNSVSTLNNTMKAFKMSNEHSPVKNIFTFYYYSCRGSCLQVTGMIKKEWRIYNGCAKGTVRVHQLSGVTVTFILNFPTTVVQYFFQDSFTPSGKLQFCSDSFVRCF